MEENKKRAAAMAAVMQYLQSAAAVAIPADTAETAAELPVAAPPPAGMWAQSGRQAAMQMRGMMQMKTFHGARLR